MPYVLKHSQSGEIAACVQRNNYNLDYFGVKQWEQEDTAEQEKQAFVETVLQEDPNAWMLLSVNESRVKVFNVKLKNDPARQLLMDSEGNLSVQTRV